MRMANSKYVKLIKKINFYPPLWAAGIRVSSYNEKFTRFEVELRSRWYNRNLFGTHFGGSLYSMCDPFYVFIITLNLGRNYIVWDKSASINFLKPAQGTIYAAFEISKERLARIQEEVDQLHKNTCHFDTKLIDENDQVVATARKEVYVRRKSTQAPSPQSKDTD